MAEPFARIRQWGDPVLRAQARPVERFDRALADRVSELAALMLGANGAGLAATQIGVLQRLFVYRLAEDETPRAIVNPRLAWAGEERETDLEGCLSLGRAAIHVEVERARDVVVEGAAPDGGAIRIEAAGAHARVLQHEIDHLDGVLMLDRTTAAQRREAIRALMAGTAWRPASAPAGP